MRSVRLISLAATVVALSGVFSTWAADAPKAGLTVDKDKKTVSVDCKIAPRKINDPAYKEIYPIEVIACWPWAKDEKGTLIGGQKAHETVVTFEKEVKPSMVHKALEDLGLKPGTPVVGGTKKDIPQGPEVGIFLEFTAADGQMKKVPIEKTMIDPKTKKNLPPLKWRFTGSVMTQPDPGNPAKVYGADLTGTLISIFPVTNQTVFQTQLTMDEEKYIKLETDKELLPKEGAPAKLIIQVK
jgi:hypothetical protein